MSKIITTVNTAADTFEVFINRVNEVINAMATEVVTVNTSANGALTSGNGHVNGVLSSTTFAANNIRGGNVQTSGVLTVLSNTVFSTKIDVDTSASVGNSTVNAFINSTAIVMAPLTVNSTILTYGANAYINATTFFVGNSTVNTTISQQLVRSQNSTSSANVTPDGFAVGLSVVNSTAIFVGNSTINTIHSQLLLSSANSTSSANVTPGGLVAGISVVNTTAFAVGVNVVANSTVFYVGNSTVNTTISQQLVRSQNSTSSANVTPGGLVAGISSINTIAIAVGTNVIANSTVFYVGNSTFNTTQNSSAFAVNGSVIDGLTAVSIDDTLVGVRRTVNFLQGSSINIDVIDDAANNRIDVQISQISSGVSNAGGSNTFIQYNDSTALTGSAGFTFNKLSNTVSVSNTLVVNGVTFDTHSRRYSNSVTTTGTSLQTIDTFLLNTYRTGEYILSVRNNSANGYETSKVHVIQDGTSLFMTEYSKQYTNGDLGTWSATANSTHGILQFTPIPANTTVKFHAILVSV